MDDDIDELLLERIDKRIHSSLSSLSKFYREVIMLNIPPSSFAPLHPALRNNNEPTDDVPQSSLPGRDGEHCKFTSVASVVR